MYADTLMVRVLIKFSSHFDNQTDSGTLFLLSLPVLKWGLNGAFKHREWECGFLTPQHEPCEVNVSPSIEIQGCLSLCVYLLCNREIMTLSVICIIHIQNWLEALSATLVYFLNIFPPFSPSFYIFAASRHKIPGAGIIALLLFLCSLHVADEV